MVLVESLSGRQRTDAALNRFLKTCDVDEAVPERLARRSWRSPNPAGRCSAVTSAIFERWPHTLMTSSSGERERLPNATRRSS